VSVIKEVNDQLISAGSNRTQVAICTIALTLTGILEQLEILNKSIDRWLYYKIGPAKND